MKPKITDLDGRGGFYYNKNDSMMGSVDCPDGEASLWDVCYPLGGNGFDLDGDGDPNTGQQFPGLYLNNLGLTGPMDPNIGLFNVNRIEMVGNEITSIATEFNVTNLPYLSVFWIHDNQLTSLPESLCEMMSNGLSIIATHNFICEPNVPSCINFSDDDDFGWQFPGGEWNGQECSASGGDWCCCNLQDGSCPGGCCYDSSHCSGWYGVCDVNPIWGGGPYGGCCVHTLYDGPGKERICSQYLNNGIPNPNWPDCLKRPPHAPY